MSDLAKIRDLLGYDPSTGVFTWRVAGRGRRIHRRAGYLLKETGYRKLFVLGKLRAEHRLVWFYVHGRWPSGEIDHINHVRDDNRIENLREVSRLENAKHRKDPGSIRTYGNGKWYAHVQRDLNIISLGVHESKQAALSAIEAFIEREQSFAMRP